MSGYEHSIDEIVETIWSSTLGMPVEQDDPLQLDLTHTHVIAGVVQISGQWDGAVAVQCTDALARRVTTAMMGIPDAFITRTDIQDTLGELANMTGGNFKALLPAGCVLGLPVVVEGDDFRMRLPGSVQVQQCAYRSHEQPFSVTVLRRLSDAA